jgi:2-oxoglutarate dehydrogenase E1 component
MHRQWLADPAAVDPQWRQFFQGFDLGVRTAADRDLSTGSGVAPGAESAVPPSAEVVGAAQTRQRQVDALIEQYRQVGHLAADLDPLGTQRPFPDQLTLESFGLSDADLHALFDPGLLPIDKPARLSDIVELLEDTYCRHVGVEYMHIQDREERLWLQQRMESVRNKPSMTREQKLRVLQQLIKAGGLEQFLETRYKGKKRFGLDGGESLIPLLDEIIEAGPSSGVEEFTIGMAHRGRLNVLVNILKKTYAQIFTEFDEAWVEDFLEGGGDVKYHRGYSADHVTAGGRNVRLTLSPNPSHLEFVNSVVLGRARAKQRLRRDAERQRCVPVLIHGDASFPGQGIVAECFNMMKLEGYTVGGTIHVVINNQVGFTTDPTDAHSGDYCTDIARMVQAPILHVNGDDPEACVHAARLALDFRQAFKRDVVIDLWCYRKAGHNETDEPSFTQPLMYARIRKQESVLQRYAKQLVAERQITRQEFDDLYERLRAELDEVQTRTKEKPVATHVGAFASVWAGLTQTYNDAAIETGAPRELLERVADALGHLPEGFTPHARLVKMLEARRESVRSEAALDWGMGELLAYGSLVIEGHPVRLTGQDVARGTFSHRHAVLFDQKNGKGYSALQHIAPDQADFRIYNSPLTEAACVGFEYGFSLGDPRMLVIWEAQFGDFANGAQVIFDQFIASAEVKWKRFSGLTLFLPHGYEGQGPEHSSGRLERFLTLCANNNVQVVYPTTPAQHFHLLRRQVKRNFRKPLVVMTPKSLLRHPEATSRVEDLVKGSFQLVLDDAAASDPTRVRRLILCTGKVFYDLVEQRRKVGRNDLAIVRVEQLYPFPRSAISAVLDRYHHAEEKVWVQEEPKNMGAWRFMDATMREAFDLSLKYVGRDEHASPAVASTKMHEQQQEKLLIAAVGLPSDGAGLPPKDSPTRETRADSTTPAAPSPAESDDDDGGRGSATAAPVPIQAVAASAPMKDHGRHAR